MKIDVRNRSDAFFFSGLNGCVEICFPEATGDQLQKIESMFSRGWCVETTLTPGNALVRLVHSAPELLAAISFDPHTLDADARLSWAVDDLSAKGGVTRQESSDWLTALVDLADHLDEIRPLSSSSSIPLEITLPTGGTIPNFVSFRDGIGGGWSQELFHVDFSACPNWPSFTATALKRIERLGGSEAFEKRIRKAFGKASTGESAVVLAILFAVDYRRLADKLCEESGRTFLQYLEYTSGRHLLAVLACLMRED